MKLMFTMNAYEKKRIIWQGLVLKWGLSEGAEILSVKDL